MLLSSSAAATNMKHGRVVHLLQRGGASDKVQRDSSQNHITQTGDPAFPDFPVNRTHENQEQTEIQYINSDEKNHITIIRKL